MTDSEAWHEWRLGGIGASDVAAAATGRYGGATKSVAVRLGVEADPIDPALAARGHRWEQPIADMVWAAKRLRVVAEQSWLEHPENRRRRYTSDGLLVDVSACWWDDAAEAWAANLGDVEATLEIKTRQPFAPWPWDYWEAHAQAGMEIAGVDRCLLAIATIDTELDPATGDDVDELDDLKLRWVTADPFVQANLAGIAEDLLAHVDAGELPEPTDAGALPYLEERYRIADPEAEADIDDLAELLERYDELSDAAKVAADERRAARAKVVHRMRKATEAHTTDRSWRVRLGSPVRRFTRSAENDFIETFCVHNDDCPPDCDIHRPDLLEARLDLETAEQEGYGDAIDEFKHPTTERRLTIKRLAPDTTETP